MISISRPSSLFLWLSIRTAVHPGVFSDLVIFLSLFHCLVGHLDFLDSGTVDIVAVEESKKITDFAADFSRVSLHQS